MRRITIFMVAGATLMLAGCSGGGGSGGTGKGGGGNAKADAGPASSTVAEAVRHIPAKAAYVEFGDLAGMRKADGGGLDGPFAELGDSGNAQIAAAGLDPGALPNLTGIDLAKVTAAYSFGQDPTTVGILTGTFDPGAIGVKLSALGYKPGVGPAGGESVWILRDDHEMSADDQLAQLGISDAFNVIHVSSARIVYGGATADLAAMTATGSLADDPASAGVAGCLGAAKAAAIQAHVQNWPGVLGIGVTGDAKAQTQEICAATGSDADAQALAKQWPSFLATAQDTSAGVPWTNFVSQPHAEVVGGPGHVVRLTARGIRADILFQAMRSGDLGSLSPSSSPGA